MNEYIKREQHYAVSKEGVLLHINQAHYKNIDCYCPYCGRHMLQKCGNIRQWHFAHDYRDIDEDYKQCSYESYLHKYAKFRIKQWLDESKSIILYYNTKTICPSYAKCFWRAHIYDECTISEQKSIDLKVYFDTCEIEKEVHEGNETFRPDLLLTNSKNPKNQIYFEIKVNHECSEKKKNSNAKIIEFEIHSEEDVDYIINHDIIESNSVRFYGFKTTIRDKKEQIKPLYHLVKFIVYKSNKVFANKKCTCQNYLKHHPKSMFEMTTKDENIDIEYFYTIGLKAAIDNGFRIRNCYLCKHHKCDIETKCIKCLKTNSEFTGGNHAIECKEYEINEIYCSHLRDKVNWFIQENQVHFWSQKGDY